jgi:hypothetical protein
LLCPDNAKDKPQDNTDTIHQNCGIVRQPESLAAGNPVIASIFSPS